MVLRAHLAAAEPIALDVLERQAVDQRAALKADYSRISAARSRVSGEGARYYPTIAASVHGEMAPGGRLVRVTDVSGDDYLVSGSLPLGDAGVFTPDFRYGAGVSIDGRLYDFGRTSSAVKAARAELDAASEDAKVRRRAIVDEVRNAYLAWLAAVGGRDIWRQIVNDARSLRESREGEVEEGARPGAEASPARYDEVQAELDFERAEAAIELSRLALERASGGKLPATAEPDFTLLDVTLGASTAPAPPEVLALERRRDASSAVAAMHRKSSLPVVTGNVDLGMRGQGATLFPLYRVGVALSLPLFDGGAESASAARAEAEADALTALASELRAEASLGGRQAQVSAERAEREIAITQRLVEHSEQVLRHAEEQLELDGGLTAPVVEARIRRSRAELALFLSRVARVRTILILRHFQGR